MKKFLVTILILLTIGCCTSITLNMYLSEKSCNVYFESKECMEDTVFVYCRLKEENERRTYSIARNQSNKIRIGKNAKIYVKGLRIPFTRICQTIEEVYEY